jgi:hypothetical protein
MYHDSLDYMDSAFAGKDIQALANKYITTHCNPGNTPARRQTKSENI